MPDAVMTHNENPRSRSRLGRPRPHDLRFRVNLIGGTLFTALITLGSAEGFSPGSEALSVRALGAIFKVSQPYGAVDKEVNATPGGVHAGIDFAAPRATAVRAVRDGTAIAAGGPSGTVAVFDGENTVLYIHMQDIDASKLNERITVGTFLGTVGRVGATGVHLHIEVRKGRHEVGVGCTVDEYVKMWPKKKSPKGYCDSPRQVANLTLDPVEYLIGVQRAEGSQAPAQTKGGTSGAEGVVWSVPKGWAGASCTVDGRISSTIDLANQQTAKAFLYQGKEYALAKCQPRLKPEELVGFEVPVLLYSPRYQDGRKVAVLGIFRFDKSRDPSGFSLSGYDNYIAAEAKQKQERIAAEAKQKQEQIAAEAKQKQREAKIEAFKKRSRVDVWLASSDIRNSFTSNPFPWKGKIVGCIAEFGFMRSENSGIFSLGGTNFVVISNIPATRFTGSGQKAMVAGRVQGVTQATLPMFGTLPVPEIILSAVEDPPD